MQQVNTFQASCEEEHRPSVERLVRNSLMFFADRIAQRIEQGSSTTTRYPVTHRSGRGFSTPFLREVEFDAGNRLPAIFAPEIEKDIQRWIADNAGCIRLPNAWLTNIDDRIIMTSAEDNRLPIRLDKLEWVSAQDLLGTH